MVKLSAHTRDLGEDFLTVIHEGGKKPGTTNVEPKSRLIWRMNKDGSWKAVYRARSILVRKAIGFRDKWMWMIYPRDSNTDHMTLSSSWIDEDMKWGKNYDRSFKSVAAAKQHVERCIPNLNQYERRLRDTLYYYLPKPESEPEPPIS